MNVAQETLGLRRQGFSPCLSLLMSAFALPISPADLTIHLRRLTERSPTAHALLSTRSVRIPAATAARRMIPPFGRLESRDSRPAYDPAFRPPRLCFLLRFARDSVARIAGYWNALKGTRAPAASVCSLSPVTSSAQDDSTSELLRFL